MPRPTTKAALLSASQAGFERLLHVADSTMEEPGQAGAAPAVRDVLGHLHAWHVMMVGWYEEGMVGGRPEIPAPGHTWRTLPALNEEIRARYQDRDLTEVRGELVRTHEHLQELISSLSDDELFTKRRYPWTGSTSVGAYFVSATSSHYDWAVKELRKVRTAR
jgi:hypothetical protein